MTRRTLITAALAAPLLPADHSKPFRYRDVEAKIARRDFTGIFKEDLGTPSLLVDRALIEKNLQKMADHCKANGLDLRAHCKVHKSVDLSRKQLALGGVGICCATIAETELMVNAGFKNTLYSCQPAGKNKIWRAITLASKDPTTCLVADDPLTVDLLDEAAASAGIKARVLVDLHAGLTRAGHATGTPGMELAKRIDSKKNLKFAGVMGYSGGASHTKGWQNRKEKSRKDVVPVVETAELCRKAGLDVKVVTGGSTGTYNIDKELGITELQAGSYAFMDTGYHNVGSQAGSDRYSDWELSLTVLTTVISRNHPNQVTIDAGNKAMLKPTDQVKGRPELSIENQGAEYGIVKWKDGDGLKLGQKLELYTTNLDMTTNCYDRYYVCDGDRVVDVWPIMGRAGAVQR